MITLLMRFLTFCGGFRFLSCRAVIKGKPGCFELLRALVSYSHAPFCVRLSCSSGHGLSVAPLPPPSHPPQLLAAPPRVLWKQCDDFISIMCDNDLFYFSRGICIQIGQNTYIYFYIKRRIQAKVQGYTEEFL